jgi:hypothetical protein
MALRRCLPVAVMQSFCVTCGASINRHPEAES